MKRLCLFATAMFTIAVLNAQIDGPYSGGTITITAIPGSSKTWTNITNASGSDNAYATFGNLPNVVGAYTDYLVITNFGFAIPPGSVISGIEVDIERSDASRRTGDYSIRIVKNGVIGTDDKSQGVGYPGADNIQAFGSAAYLWGDAWTVADINDPGFGVAIAAQRLVGGGVTNGKIDDVQILVFYDFTITPVRLISFAATKKNTEVQLTWTTADEVNMDRYEVERSSNGINFETIGTVASQNHSSQFTYTYEDKNPPAGTSYYRLRLVGTAPRDVGYSKIVSVKFNDQNKIGLYPNPIQHGNDLRINNSSGQQLNILFFNMAGQKVADVKTSSTTVPASSLFTQRGILMYKVYSADKAIVAVGKLLVE